MARDIAIIPGQIWRDRTFDALAKQTAHGTLCRILPSARTIRIVGYSIGPKGSGVSFEQITDRDGRHRRKSGDLLVRTLRKRYELVGNAP